MAEERAAARLNPDNALIQFNLGAAYVGLRQWPRAMTAFQMAIKLAPNGVDGAFGLALVYTQLHCGADAVKAFDLVRPVTPLDRQLVDAGRLAYQAQLTPGLRARAFEPAP